MQVVVIGVNQSSAPVAVRERLAYTPATIAEALARLHEYVAEGFILSTCNRVEIYGLVGHADSGATLLRQFLSADLAISPELLQPYLYCYAHEAAVEHIFNVAAGLDSMVLGEDQIMMQLKAALDDGQAAGTLGPIMHRLGAAALSAGKRVRAQTAIGRNHTSVVSVGLDLAKQSIGDLTTCPTLVIGAGHMAELTLKHLSGSDAARITVANRTYERGAVLASRYGANVIPLSQLAPALAEHDLVISCTGAAHTIIERDLVRQVMHARAERPLLVLDLAVPRDVEMGAGEVPGITLHTVDSLQPICEANRSQRGQEVANARQIIAQEVSRFMEWWQSREVAPTIAALHAHAGMIRDGELSRALARLPNLSEHEQEVVKSLAAGIVNKLLHRPVTILKTSTEAANTALVVQELFGLANSARDDLPEQVSLARQDEEHVLQVDRANKR